MSTIFFNFKICSKTLLWVALVLHHHLPYSSTEHREDQMNRLGSKRKVVFPDVKQSLKKLAIYF